MKKFVFSRLGLICFPLFSCYTAGNTNAQIIVPGPPPGVSLANDDSCRESKSTAISDALLPSPGFFDSDGDGVNDCEDGCLLDAGTTSPGACGCGVSDDDSDGTPDCSDACPNDPAKTAPGILGCGISDVDTDNDGTLDNADDQCPSDPAKTTPGACGCGNSDSDSDSDGTPDCQQSPPPSFYVTDIASETRNTLSVSGFSPLRILGDLNFDGRIDSSDLSAMTGFVDPAHTATLCEMLTGDINEDGLLNSEDLPALQDLVSLYVLSPDAEFVLRPMRGLPDACPTVRLAIRAEPDFVAARWIGSDGAGEFYSTRKQSGSETMVGRVVSPGGEDVSIPANLLNEPLTPVFKLLDRYFVLPLSQISQPTLPDVASMASTAVSSFGEDVLNDELLRTSEDSAFQAGTAPILGDDDDVPIPADVRTAPNDVNLSTVWSQLGPEWRRLLPRRVRAAVPPAGHENACHTDAEGRRRGHALIIQLLSDWRLRAANEANMLPVANGVDEDFDALVAAATAKNFEVFSLNVSRDARMRVRPERTITCRRDSFQLFGRNRTTTSDTAAMGAPCVWGTEWVQGQHAAQGGQVEAPLWGTVVGEARTVAAQTALIATWNTDKTAIERDIALLEVRFEGAAQRGTASTFIYIHAHGSRPDLQLLSREDPELTVDELTRGYGIWTDGVGMASASRHWIIGNSRLSSRVGNSCNFTFVDASCYAAASLWGRNRAANCDQRPARYISAEAGEPWYPVSRFLSVGNPWRIATATEIRARNVDLLAAFNATTQTRLNLALRNIPQGTGNFGDAYHDWGYNDPTVCR